MTLEDKEILDDFYTASAPFNTHAMESPLGRITEKDKFLAAKQILLGLAILYLLTLSVYLIRPIDAVLDICTTVFPPLVTLILAFYFREKCH